MTAEATKISSKQVQVTRVFRAARPTVFKYWSEAEKLEQWSGCKDSERCEISMDFRVGGSFTQKMQIAGAGEFTITGRYLEIVEPERIVYEAILGSFAKSLVTVEFFEDGRGTRVALTQSGLPDDNICGFIAQGTSESFDKLEAWLPLEKAPA